MVKIVETDFLREVVRFQYLLEFGIKVGGIPLKHLADNVGFVLFCHENITASFLCLTGGDDGLTVHRRAGSLDVEYVVFGVIIVGGNAEDFATAQSIAHRKSYVGFYFLALNSFK